MNIIIALYSNNTLKTLKLTIIIKKINNNK